MSTANPYDMLPGETYEQYMKRINRMAMISGADEENNTTLNGGDEMGINPPGERQPIEALPAGAEPAPALVAEPFKDVYAAGPDKPPADQADWWNDERYMNNNQPGNAAWGGADDQDQYDDYYRQMIHQFTPEAQSAMQAAFMRGGPGGEADFNRIKDQEIGRRTRERDAGMIAEGSGKAGADGRIAGQKYPDWWENTPASAPAAAAKPAAPPAAPASPAPPRTGATLPITLNPVAPRAGPLPALPASPSPLPAPSPVSMRTAIRPPTGTPRGDDLNRLRVERNRWWEIKKSKPAGAKGPDIGKTI